MRIHETKIIKSPRFQIYCGWKTQNNESDNCIADEGHVWAYCSK